MDMEPFRPQKNIEAAIVSIKDDLNTQDSGTVTADKQEYSCPLIGCLATTVISQN